MDLAPERDSPGALGTYDLTIANLYSLLLHAPRDLRPPQPLYSAFSCGAQVPVPRVPRAPEAQQLQGSQCSHALWAPLLSRPPFTGFPTYLTVRVPRPRCAGKPLALSGLSDHQVFVGVVGGLAARWAQRKP